MAKSVKRFAPLPRVTSKTITVGALLGKIKRLILAEPKRLDMDRFMTALKGRTVGDLRIESDLPACGTVACIAGWGATLLRSTSATVDAISSKSQTAMEHAIGYGTDRQVGPLFGSYGYFQFGEENYLPDPGTPEHAAVIAKRIDTYLSQHPEIVHRKIIVADVQKALRG